MGRGCERCGLEGLEEFIIEFASLLNKKNILNLCKVVYNFLKSKTFKEAIYIYPWSEKVMP